MSAREPIAVLGAGGHGKVVISTLQAAGYHELVVFDDDSRKWGQRVLGLEVRGPLAELANSRLERGVLAIGDNPARQAVAGQWNLRWLSVSHPAAYVHPSVRIGDGSVVLAGAVVQPDSVLGDHVIINTGATVDHDCGIGDFTHVGPGAHLAGQVRLGPGCFLGIGCKVLPGIQIGAWTTVGAGGVVLRNLPERVVAVGIPAKVLCGKDPPHG